MEINVEGRVKNITLPINKFLLPIFEAIVNSIQAIHELPYVFDGEVRINVIRSSNELILGRNRISAFEILDNGIGFNGSNFKSFDTSDSTYKSDKGGKGVGRFLWLKAFDEVQIESVFKEHDKMFRRKFKFVQKGKGIINHVCEDYHSDLRQTIIKLNGYKEKYRNRCPIDIDKIAEYIVEYCLQYFIRDDCPRITLVDVDEQNSIDLNQYFDDIMQKDSHLEDIQIKSFLFSARHIKLRSSYKREPLLHLCANRRVVISEQLVKYIPDLKARLTEPQEADQAFVYTVYVDSDLFDNKVNAERTGFDLPNDKSEIGFDEITRNEIIQGIIGSCKSYLEPYVIEIRQSKNEKVQEFISQRAPMYKPIMSLQQTKDKIEMMDPAIKEDDIELYLYKILKDLQVEAKSEGEKLFNENEHVDNEDYAEMFQSYFEKIIAVNAADLARYVCDRKVILELVKKLLDLQKEGKYSQEKEVHNIVFPMGKTNEDTDFNNHNLWLIDERLVYHRFIASDKQLRTISQSKSQKEPDIVIFDNALAYTEDDACSSIVIIELKRPMRIDYSDKDNPVKQVYGYIKDIQKGNRTTNSGRQFKVKSGTPFFGYIICDLSDRITEFAKDAAFIETPDQMGYFGYNQNYNAYIEIISYDKLISDSQKRNAILFEKLGLPSRIDSPMQSNI